MSELIPQIHVEADPEASHSSVLARDHAQLPDLEAQRALRERLRYRMYERAGTLGPTWMATVRESYHSGGLVWWVGLALYVLFAARVRFGFWW